MASNHNEKSLDVSFEGQHATSVNSWEEFLAAGNPITLNSNLILRHLVEAEERLFCTPEKMKFDFLDIFGEGVSFEVRV